MNNKENYKNEIDKIHASNDLKQKTMNRIKSQNKNKKYLIFKALATCMIFVMVLCSGVVIYNKTDLMDLTDKKVANVSDDLPRFKDIEELRTVLNKRTNKQRGFSSSMDVAVKSEAVFDAADMSAATSTNSEESSDYSKTNNQVDNVDEADIVKTNGKNIFYISNGKVFIVDAEKLEILSEIDFEEKEDENFSVKELFINGDKLILLGNSYKLSRVRNSYFYEDIMYDYAGIGSDNTSQAVVYDISNIKNPKQIRTINLDGAYMNSRMIGNSVYFISNKSIYYSNDLKDEEILPYVKDTAVSEEKEVIEANDIIYLKNSSNYCYLLVAGFNVDDDSPANIETLFGASDTVYASEENLYITWEEFGNSLFGNDYDYKTTIYKFGLDNSKVSYKCKTKIRGELNNQFSMDEYEGNLRIATTTSAENRLYVLDEELQEIGKITNMARGERIYSVRFIGKIGYVVTFKQIDPLFVIDLSDPTNPEIKGELKIPGYSSYLHPYDENHIIGIGYNTKSNGYGGVRNANMKMSMFDVSDLENPKEIFNIDIGDSDNIYSPINNNHKALFYNKEKNLIGFPIYSYGYNRPNNSFMIFEIDLEKGFKKYGSLETSYDWNSNSNRAIYIKDKLFVLTQDKVISYDLKSLEEIKVLDLK